MSKGQQEAPQAQTKVTPKVVKAANTAQGGMGKRQDSTKNDRS